MKSHFIKDTNEQYSIREDGVIVKHFIWRGRKEYNHKIIKDTLIPYKKHPTRNVLYVAIRSNGKTFNFFKNALLAKYFSFIICPSCNNKVRVSSHIRVCKTCVKENETKTRLNWRKNNKEKILISTRKSANKNYPKYKDKIISRAKEGRRSIIKAYVASKLQIPVAELPDELYVHYRNLLLLKRKIAKKHNLPVHTLK